MVKITDFRAQCRSIIHKAGVESIHDRLHELFALGWERRLQQSPEWATYVGHARYQDRWSDLSPEGLASLRDDNALLRETLGSIDMTELDDDDRLNYELFAFELNRENERQSFAGDLQPITQMDGVQQEPASILEMMPLRTHSEREQFLTRLERLSALVDQSIELMKRGIEQGVTPPAITMRDVPQQVLNQAPEDPSDSPLLAAIRNAPPEVRDDLTAQASRLYVEQIRPAYGRLHEFLTTTYLPACREEIAWTALPNGRDWYDILIRQNTTLQITPEKIHEIGLAEVARIRAEMDEVIKSSGFEGDFDAFCEFLRTDPQFFCATPNELLQRYRDIAKRVDPELVRQFGLLPRLPYGVTPIPSYAEKSQTTAYYQPGSPKAGRPGYFYANTYDLKSRPIWEMEALTLHEAVPGHHLQISLAQELEDIPEFRRQSWITAYGEGWALYSESLGTEMGFYADPYSRFGQLTYEMWRAIRLVLDPGLHVMGWSREKAIEFFRQNSSKSLHDIEVEVDRYIVWPGQAVSYKIGELKIKEMRAKAEKALGDRFNVRSFHDELLGAGCLPLMLLERRMDLWLARRVDD